MFVGTFNCNNCIYPLTFRKTCVMFPIKLVWRHPYEFPTQWPIKVRQIHLSGIKPKDMNARQTMYQYRTDTEYEMCLYTYVHKYKPVSGSVVSEIWLFHRHTFPPFYSCVYSVIIIRYVMIYKLLIPLFCRCNSVNPSELERNIYLRVFLPVLGTKLKRV